jgi:serine/threonine protein kinase
MVFRIRMTLVSDFTLDTRLPMTDANMQAKENESPAHRLVGLTLDTGWKVISKHERPPDTTGGKYSVCYHVEKDGQKAFLKALDFSRATTDKSQDLARALQALTEAFNFERDVLRTCAARRMDRVIAPLEDGEALVDRSPLGRVPYLIFEQAEGDVRRQIALFDLTLRLRALHHIATGLFQLHRSGIAHQDLKPSNVLKFGDISKVSDLGCASVKGKSGPMDSENCPGDKTYGPPELLYGYTHPEFNVRRFGCDAYLLGSMVIFFFTGVSATAGILQNLRPEHWPKRWDGTYEGVLPYVRNAFDTAVNGWAPSLPGNKMRATLLTIIRQLCEPDPALRGHPENQFGFTNRYSLERYVSSFDLLAKKARMGMLG